MQSEFKLSLQPQSPESADAAVKQLLGDARARLGFVPNMYANMANGQGMLETYIHGYELFRATAGLTPMEQEVVFLAISRQNECGYCMAAHSFVADVMSKVPEAITNAIRDDRPVPDAKLAALAIFSRTMVATRGLPTRKSVEEFLAAGYTERHVLSVILAVSVKTLSNYANHLFHTPVDQVFSARAWQTPSASK